jgi:protein-disulfide isomerase
MSKGSAIISIAIAFVAGLAIGNLVGGGGGATTEVATAEIAAEGAGAAEDYDGPGPGDDVERFRVQVSDEMPSRGAAQPLVTIAMFSDFQCPFCSRVEPTIDQILREFGDEVRVYWRDNPLPFHQQAMPAAEAAREAFAQGGSEKFWEMHELLFENQRALSNEDLERYAQQIGLDMNRYRAAMEDHRHREGAQADQQAANSIGARGTPAFFINGRQLMGAQPFPAFQSVIREEIQAAQRLIADGTPRNQLYGRFQQGARTSPAPQPEREQPQRQRRQPDPDAVYRVPVGDSAVKGPANALVTIVEFSEFQCPFCSRVLPTVGQIMERYGDDVRFVFKHNPLPFHQNAMPAAEAALEVHAQRGDEAFWAFHDVLFENQRELTRENLERWASEVPGIDMGRFRRALDEHTHQAAVEADQTLARSLGATGTPSFFINGRNLRGAQPFAAFQRVIDQELARARDALAAGTPRARLYESLIANGATSPQFLDAPGGGDTAPARPAEPPADQVYEIAVPSNAPSKGPANAPVTIQIFSDFQCPFCGRVLPTITQVEERFGRQVRMVWRNYPLPFHQQAMPAAEAAMEVFAQRGDAAFWQFHDILFENQRALSREDLERYAGQISGIDMARFRRALDDNTHRAAVQADMDAVREAGARIGTPSFFINGRLLQGAQPFPAFEQAIQRALQEAE